MIEGIKNAKGERKYYEGYGRYMTAAEWARALDLPRMTVWQYLQRGMTPEEIAANRSVEELSPAKIQRKPRTGHRLTETKEKMEELLEASDYDPDGLEVHNTSGAFRHQIIWNDILIGHYDPTKDWLKLTGGEWVKLRCPLVDDQQIYHEDRVWYITPETRQAIHRAAYKGL